MKKILIIGLFSLFTFVLVSAQDVKVIVNSSNATASLSKAQLSNIFMKKISKFPNGVAALPVDQVPSSPARSAFSSAYLGKSVSAVKNYWNQQLFSGAGVPPVEKASDADVVNFVKSNPGAIGYVSSGADVSNVKLISIQ